MDFEEAINNATWLLEGQKKKVLELYDDSEPDDEDKVKMLVEFIYKKFGITKEQLSGSEMQDIRDFAENYHETT